MTISEAIDDFLLHLQERNVSPQTARSYRGALRRVLTFLWASAWGPTARTWPT
jgi:site-specific recombinase XerD